MTRNYPPNPAMQPIKGIFIFKKGDAYPEKAIALLKSLRCEIVATHENRVTVKTSRGNLQTIKQSWLSDDDTLTLNSELKESITQIIIGGNV